MKKSRKTLPLEKISNGNYNNVAGNNIAGEPQRKWVGKCTDADIRELNKLIENLNLKHRLQLSLLIHFLAVSSDEQQKKQYLDQLLKESSTS